MEPVISHQKRRGAIEQFANPLQRALTAFAHGSLHVGVPEVGGSSTITFNDHNPTLLRTDQGAAAVAISIALTIRLEDRDGPYVKTVGWSHAVFLDGADRLRYDWHPAVTPAIPFPHVHIDDAKAHIPTGRVLVEDVLIAALEFGALPISTDWKTRLTGARSAFAETAEWGLGDVETAQGWLHRWDEHGRVAGK